MPKTPPERGNGDPRAKIGPHQRKTARWKNSDTAKTGNALTEQTREISALAAFGLSFIAAEMGVVMTILRYAGAAY